MTSALVTTVYGAAGDQPPLLIAHGLFGSGRNWGVLARRLAEDRQVITVDMRNHGDSFRADDHSYPALADDLRRITEKLGEVDMLGHSMGGKAAMVLALSQPAALRRLIVADIAPVGYRHSHADLIDALRRADMSGVTRRAEADARLRDGIDDPALRAFLLQSLDLTGDTPRWKLNLAALAQNMDAIIGFPKVLGSFTGEVLFLTGAGSDYVRPEHHETILKLFSKAAFKAVPDAGHWLHAENPRAVEDAVRAFLS